MFEEELLSHPDKLFCEYIVAGIRFGFPLGFKGPNASYIQKNMSSVREHGDVVENYIRKEVAAGRILGPFADPPLENFRASPIGVIPKKAPNSFRFIMNLSSPSGASVNDFISKDDYSLEYVSVDSAIERILTLGKGCELVKIDVEKAFRIIPVHPSDWNLLGFAFREEFYIDTVLSMGGRSSPAIFDDVAVAIEWICKSNYGIDFLIHYLDDYFSAQLPGQGREVLDRIIKVFHKLGVPLNEDKIEGPATVLEFLGITLDTVVGEARLSEEKVSKLLELLISFDEKSSCRQKDLLSLVGVMSFACRVVVPGRSFLSRIIALAYSVKELHHRIKLPGHFRKDVRIWKRFVERWNGREFFISNEGAVLEAEFSTDAAGGVGFGGFHGKQWFSHRWTNEQKSFSIDTMEMYPIAVAASVWGEKWKNKKVWIHCDNLSVVRAINGGYTKVPVMSDLMRVIVFSSMIHNFKFRATHIPGKLNVLSDHLSRLQVTKFLERVPEARGHQVRSWEDPLLTCNRILED